MNPEENNPLTNPGMPGTGAADSFGMNPGMPPTTSGLSGLSTDDSMASAENTLTSAGMAADTGAQTMGLDQISATQPEAIMAPPIEEPLVPAAPVPGSIGSVTSVPAAEPTTQTDAMMGAGPMSAPEAAPQMPYNPFATNNSGAAPAANTPEATLPPATQPAAIKAEKPKMHRPTNIPMILLGGLSAILLITTIIFFVLWRQAVDNPKIVYMPSTSNDEVTASIRLLSCSHENDYNYLIGYEQAVLGTESVVASYTNDTLQGLSLTNQATFNSNEDANIARDNFVNSQAAFVASLGSSFDTAYDVNDATMEATINSKNGQLAPNDAMMFIYGNTDAGSATTMSAVQAHYEAAGFICSVE